MKPNDKRFWNWRTLIVVLVISPLIAIVVFFKRCMATDTADIERVGNEIIVMIDDFHFMRCRDIYAAERWIVSGLSMAWRVSSSGGERRSAR